MRVEDDGRRCFCCCCLTIISVWRRLGAWRSASGLYPMTYVWCFLLSTYTHTGTYNIVYDYCTLSYDEDDDDDDDDDTHNERCREFSATKGNSTELTTTKQKQYWLNCTNDYNKRLEYYMLKRTIRENYFNVSPYSRAVRFRDENLVCFVFVCWSYFY